MRYAIIRGGEGLASLEAQRRSLARLPCDVVLQEERVTPGGQRWILQRAGRLAAGDELCVWSLDVLQLPTLELLRLLERYAAAGVRLRLTRGGEGDVLDASTSAGCLLALLGEHERRRPRQATARRGRPGPRSLTRHQLRHAREMLRAGSTLREVGLLFALSPDEVARQMEAEPGSRPLRKAQGAAVNG